MTPLWRRSKSPAERPLVAQALKCAWRPLIARALRAARRPRVALAFRPASRPRCSSKGLRYVRSTRSSPKGLRYLPLLVPIVALSQPVGDAARGRALVESTKCFDCHRIGETGSRVGPDLSEVGSARTADQLRRALVAPDADVLPEHRFVRLVTRDGQEIVGRLLNQDTLSIQVLDQREQLRAYLKSNLREVALQQKGLMPSYERTLTPDQVADVVAYLGSLKGTVK